MYTDFISILRDNVVLQLVGFDLYYSLPGDEQEV